MAVDVLTEIVINRPRNVVAQYAADPGNAPQWYVNIRAVHRETPPPLTVGSPLAFVAPRVRRQNQKDLTNLKDLLER